MTALEIILIAAAQWIIGEALIIALGLWVHSILQENKNALPK